jgi:glyoxylase-like metal-dependent hydrolase (beta-lactamase superfamily II)
MDYLWGRIVPVPERNLRVLEGGETISVAGRELEVDYAPGHASHHVVYFDRSDAAAYVGDVAGVRIPPSDFVRAPTPPPDIDVELWERSIDAVAARKPSWLALTHFGAVERPAPHLERAKAILRWQSELARRLLAEHDDPEQARHEFVAEVTRITREACDPGTLAVFEQGAAVDQLWQGLRRYWERQRERAL